jgi:hypothetical protein
MKSVIPTNSQSREGSQHGFAVAECHKHRPYAAANMFTLFTLALFSFFQLFNIRDVVIDPELCPSGTRL